MAGRHPVPLAKALTEGREVIQPGRYKERTDISGEMPSLGDAPEWVKNEETCRMLDAWNLFREEAPWLKSSHRMLVAMASQLQGCMMASIPLDVKEMTLLKNLLSSMGMTPVDAGKVIAPQAGGSKEPEETDVTAARKRR